MKEFYYMKEDQKMKCHAIIHSASLATAGIGAGLAQIPGSDNIAIVPIQVTMVIALGAVFNMDLDKSSARATLSTAAATMAGRTLSQVLVGWIPGVGNAVNSVTAASITQAIGWAVAKDFHRKYVQDKIRDMRSPMQNPYHLRDENNDDEKIEERLEYISKYLKEKNEKTTS